MKRFLTCNLFDCSYDLWRGLVVECISWPKPIANWIILEEFSISHHAHNAPSLPTFPLSPLIPPLFPGSTSSHPPIMSPHPLFSKFISISTYFNHCTIISSEALMPVRNINNTLLFHVFAFANCLTIYDNNNNNNNIATFLLTVYLNLHLTFYRQWFIHIST